MKKKYFKAKQFIILTCCLFLSFQASSQLNGWQFTTTIAIDNMAGTALTNYETKLIIDTETPILAGDMELDGRDIRFTDGVSCTEYCYYIESGINTDTTVIWVNVPAIAGAAITNISMLYGNSAATASSDANCTFAFWDGFDGPTSRLTNVCGANTVNIAGGNLDASWTSSGMLASDSTFSMTETFTLEAMVNSATGMWPGIYWAKETSEKSYGMLIDASAVRLSVAGGGTQFCTGHNWASAVINYSSVAGLWSLTWNATGDIFGEFPSIGTMTSTNTLYSKNENLRILVGGISSGAGSINMDWIRARKYTAIPPTFTVGSTSLNSPIIVLGTDVITVCDSLTWIDGNVYTANNNTATFNIVGGAVGGCDSIVTLDLTILPTALGTNVITACDSLTWIDGNVYTSNNNTATFNLVGGAVNGCDSIVALDLTVLPTVLGTDVITACDSLTWIDGNVYTANNNTATFNIVGGAVGGCDSIVTLDLTVLPTVLGTDVITACDSLTWIDGNVYNANNNTATFNLVGGGVNGCDSIVTLDLTILPTALGIDVIAVCDSLTWIDGNVYTANNNTATFNLVGGGVNGCDSIVTLDLTVNTVDVTVTNNDSIITANAIGATYQWLDCSNSFAVINGETASSYTVTVNGDYAVEVAQNGCVDTSACETVATVDIDENSFFESISIYPNPTPNQGDVNINLGNLKNVNIKVFNIQGQLVYSKGRINVAVFQFELNQTAGIYIIEIMSEGEMRQYKLVIR